MYYRRSLRKTEGAKCKKLIERVDGLKLWVLLDGGIPLAGTRSSLLYTGFLPAPAQQQLRYSSLQSRGRLCSAHAYDARDNDLLWEQRPRHTSHEDVQCKSPSYETRTKDALPSLSVLFRSPGRRGSRVMEPLCYVREMGPSVCSCAPSVS